MRELTPEQQEEEELAQIKQRPSPYRAKHIGKSIQSILARKGLGQTQSAFDLSQAWESAAGAKLAAVTRPGNLSRGVLQVFVKDSSALQELHLCRRQILTELKDALPHAEITDIRGRVG